jgi:CO/xanthine dehydrogenase FAD-binding subunit
VKPAPFDYLRPSTLAEALEALSSTADSKVLAGGQSLIPLLSMRLAAPATIIDINGLEEELAYTRSDTSGVRVGALARHAAVERDEQARKVQPLLGQALRLVAHATIRNRGTTVGSIVHADAAAEMPTVLCLLDGHATAASVRGTRQIAAQDLFLSPLETTLAHDEIMTEVMFPALPAGGGTAFDEVSRRHGDYALAGVGAVVLTDGDAVTSVRVGCISVSETPLVVDLTEAFADGRVDEAALDRAAELVQAQAEPEADIHASADYRRHLVGVLTRRVVAQAHAHSREAAA